MKLAMVAKINIPSGVFGPDDWNSPDFGSEQSLVISRDETGKVISRASDLVWDLSSYHPHRRNIKLYFIYWDIQDPDLIEITTSRLKRIREMQYMMCLIMFTEDEFKKSVRTLTTFLHTLKKIAEYCEEKDCSITEALANAAFLEAVISRLNMNYSIQRLLTFFYSNPSYVTVAKPRSWKQLCRANRQKMKSKKQHAPLPTKIYSKFISNLDEELTFIESHLSSFVEVIHQLTGVYRIVERSKVKHMRLGKDFIEGSNASSLFERYGNPKTLGGLGGVISNIYAICKTQVHLFTGMRHEEAKYLPYDCMLTEGRFGKVHALVTGFTTKLESGGKRRTKWITTAEDGFRALAIVQKIAAAIYKSLGVDLKKLKQDKYRLFVSTQYLPWNRRVNWSRSIGQVFEVAAAMRLTEKGREKLLHRITPIITAEDIVELEEIDPFRNWGNEPEFRIGVRWPINNHQLRRSLALYARASGLVSISSLRRQLQHISNDMSQYYAKGSTFAKDFFENDPDGFSDHIVKDWQEAAIEVELLGFLKDVIESDEKLFGGAGNFYFIQKKSGNLISREDIDYALRTKTMAYRPTPVGGCTKVGACDKKMGLSFTESVCITENCKNMIGKVSKITRMISLKQNLIACIDPNSVEYKLEVEEMEALILVSEKWKVESTSESSKVGNSI